MMENMYGTNKATIPQSHKFALEILRAQIGNQNTLKVRRAPSEILVMIDYNCFIIKHNNNSIYGIEFFSTSPMMSIYINSSSLTQYFNEPGYDINDILNHLR